MQNDTTSWDGGVARSTLSDVGLRRTSNQDSLACVVSADRAEWRRRGHLFMVADGMGAHAAGELASKMAVDSVPLTYYKSPLENPAFALRQAVEETNAKIHDRGLANADFKGMGTTCSVLVMLPEGAIVAQVGDSRVYRLRGDRLDQLSFDHSLVWEMMVDGKMREDQVPSYIPKNVITRSLGPNEQVRVDLEGPFPLAVGDTFLLCSDGLSNQVTDEELGVIMGTLEPKEATQALVDLANLRGGPDNITVIITRVTGAELAGAGGGRMVSTAFTGTPTNAAWWALPAVLGALTVLVLLAGKLIAGAVLGLLAAGSVVGLLVRQFGSAAASDRLETARLGRGPHRTRTCTINAEVVGRLQQVLEQLREAARDENWIVDWHKFNAYHNRATRAASQKEFAEAVREACHAISFLMSELRGQRTRRDVSRTVELD